jgi:hypothetical protein
MKLAASRIQPAQLLRIARRNWFALTIGLGVLAGASVGYVMGEQRFSAERVTMLTNIERYRNVLTDAVARQKDRPVLDAKLQDVADQMLGPSLETVDSEVRRRLNRACEELGLNDFSVTTGTSVGRQTPAKREFKGREAVKLRDQIDFTEVQATVLATGSAAKIYNLIFRVDAEPWLKRIESIRLNPNADGQQIRLSLRLTTPFMPGRAASRALVADAARLAAADRYAALFASNPFRIPPPPAPPAAVVAGAGTTAAPTPPTQPDTPAAPPAVPVADPGFPYGEWQVTGVVDGPGGAEVWLRHLPSGATLALQPGSPVGELVFRRAEYDGSAVFDSPSGVCRIQVGTNLTQRSPVPAA